MKMKGQMDMADILDLQVLAVIAASIIGIVWLLSSIGALNYIIGYGKQIEFVEDFDDSGYKTLSLLRGSSGLRISETLGYTRASGYGDRIKDQLAYMESLIKEGKLNMKVAVFDESGNKIREFREIPANALSVQIAMPGGKRGEVRLG